MNIRPGSPEFQITGKYLKQTWGSIFHIHFGINVGAKFISNLDFLKIKKTGATSGFDNGGGYENHIHWTFRKASPVHHPCF